MATIKDRGIRGHVFKNWATTYSCSPELYFEPKTTEEIKEILEFAVREKKVVKVAGGGHSPSDIACTDDIMISMRNFNKLINIDREKETFTAEAGIMISHLNVLLREKGFAISVLGSVSDLTLAGVICTGTHGTGVKYGCFPSNVQEIELMTATGDIRTFTIDDGDTFKAAALSLGCLGIILKVKVKCEKAFNLEQNKYCSDFKDVIENLDVHLKSSDHFRFMWYPHTEHCTIYHTRRTPKEVKRNKSWFWDMLIGFYLLELLLWISTWYNSLVPTINRIYSRLDSGHSSFVDISYKVFNFNCLFKQYVMEWAIPVERTGVALYELKSWIESSGFKAHFPIEIRFVRGDDLLMSPAYGHDTCYINIIMFRPYDKLVEHAEYWSAFKKIMLQNQGRPHWAKDHLMTSEELKELYPKWNDFCRIRQEIDPLGVFLNDNLKKSLGHS